MRGNIECFVPATSFVQADLCRHKSVWTNDVAGTKKSCPYFMTYSACQFALWSEWQLCFKSVAILHEWPLLLTEIRITNVEVRCYMYYEIDTKWYNAIVHSYSKFNSICLRLLWPTENDILILTHAVILGHLSVHFVVASGNHEDHDDEVWLVTFPATGNNLSEQSVRGWKIKIARIPEYLARTDMIISNLC